jgi:putative tricarboxylic transport membrane protein
MNRRLDLRGQFTGLFWLALSIVICVLALRLGIGTLHTPGPGFLLFWSGILLGILAIILRLLDYSKKKDRGRTIDLWKGLKWHKVISVAIAMSIYILLLHRIGYLIMTFGLLVFLFRIVERSKPGAEVVFALITVITTYLLFYVWLDVQLPRGLF